MTSPSGSQQIIPTLQPTALHPVQWSVIMHNRPHGAVDPNSVVANGVQSHSASPRGHPSAEGPSDTRASGKATSWDDKVSATVTATNGLNTGPASSIRGPVTPFLGRTRPLCRRQDTFRPGRLNTAMGIRLQALPINDGLNSERPMLVLTKSSG